MFRKPCLALLIGLFVTSSNQADVYLNFENGGTTWSNTQLGGGEPQPIGYIQLPDFSASFTGSFGVNDFLSWSDVKYGTTNEFTWNSSDLLGQSNVSIVNGQLSDVNLAYQHAGTLLTLSGPPTANWAIANGPSPPAVNFPGFPDFGGGFARGELSLALEAAPVSLNVVPIVPPTSAPVPQDVGIVDVAGFVSLNSRGGVSFPLISGGIPFGGQYSIVAGLTQSIQQSPAVDHQIYFTNVDVDSLGYVLANVAGSRWPQFTFFNDAMFDPNDNGYMVLNGEQSSFSAVHDNFAAGATAICNFINGNNLGLCVSSVQGGDASIALAINEGISMPTDGMAVLNSLVGLDSFGDLLSVLSNATSPIRIDAKLDGSLTYKSLPVPISEAPFTARAAASDAAVPEPSCAFLFLGGLIAIANCVRNNQRRQI